MIDLKPFINDPERLIYLMEGRGVKEARAEVSRIMTLYSKYQIYQRSVEKTRADMGLLTDRFNKVRQQDVQNPRELAGIRARMGTNKDRIARLEDYVRDNAIYRTGLMFLPNLPASDVPDGLDETHNVIVKEWGTPVYQARPKDHVALGEAMTAMDFKAAAKLSGSRNVVLSGSIARLERALGQFMLDFNLARKFKEYAVPLLVNEDTMKGTGQLPKFKDDVYRAGDKYLIPTAEVSLTNLVRDSVFAHLDAPMRMTALTPCFRSEAGSAGRDTHGLIRQHQFNKVELVSICHPDQSAAEHEYLTETAELLLQALNLPYRKVLLCKGDMGFSAQKTYDLEVWVPSQNTYREISSISNCGDFQARRMNARMRRPTGSGTIFPHTLNGSALAVGRTLVAVMENFQDEDGGIRIPDAIKLFFGEYRRIAPNGELEI